MFLRTGIMAVLCVAMTTVSLEAQNIGNILTRRGAVTGAVLGGIIGGQNDEVAAGIIAGGLVGGVTGRVLGNQLQNRSYGGGGYYYHQPRYVQPQVQYHYAPRPVYGGYGGGFGGGYYGGGCNRGW